MQTARIGEHTMHTIELPADIDQNHQIHLQLPETIKVGKAKVIVMVEETEQPEQSLTLVDFLNELPDVAKGAGLSQEEIKHYVDQERQS
jgi:hypothetical protein